METFDPAATFRAAMRIVYATRAEPFSIAALAQRVGVSLATLKRAFERTAGEPPARLVRRLRLEWAFRSLHCLERSVLEVALGAGYDDHSAFTRAFQRAFGFPPRDARKRRSIQRELAQVELDGPELVELDAFELQVVRTQGCYYECAPRAWNELAQRLRDVDANREAAIFVGQSLDDPHAGEVQPDRVRFVAGVAQLAQDLGLERLTIPARRYARFRVRGMLANLGLAYHAIYGHAGAGSELRWDTSPALMLLDALPQPGPCDVVLCVPLAT